MTKLLFVCLGNICRSPMAEGVFQSLIEAKGLQGSFSCDSAGTAGWHIGKRPDHRTVECCEIHGIKLTHRGRKLTAEDLDNFDHIAVMDEENFADVHTFYYETKHVPPPAEKLFLLRDFDPTVRGKQIVPDPYYEDKAKFEEVFQLCLQSCEGLIEHLQEKNIDSVSKIEK